MILPLDHALGLQTGEFMSGGKVARILENETDQDAIVDIDNLLAPILSENPGGLSPPEKNICYIEMLDNDVNAGGFKQFFLNPSGEFAHEVVSALREINSVKILQVVEAAVGQFPDARVPKDPNTRRVMIQQIAGMANPVWEMLDNQFSDYEEDIYALMTEYIRRNITDFR
jgi:hypothetical protein